MIYALYLGNRYFIERIRGYASGPRNINPASFWPNQQHMFRRNIAATLFSLPVCFEYGDRVRPLFHKILWCEMYWAYPMKLRRGGGKIREQVY